MQPFVVDSFLPEDQYREAVKALAGAPWAYGSKSNSANDPHGHWSWKPLHDRRENLANIDRDSALDFHPGLKTIYNKITSMLAEKRFAERWCLIRCYANAHTYGIDGYFHRDSEREDEVTAILYVCDRWDRDWAGETVVVKNWNEQDRASELMAVMPAPNRLLVLPSPAPHCARAVSRKCTELRTTMIFKLRPRRSEEFERLSSKLAGWGALKLDHGRGSLHDHLMRCYLLLEKKKLAPHVKYAGGLHSVYGTNAFKSKLLEPVNSNRAMLAQLFGREAEALAYLFSVLDRPKTLDRPPYPGGKSRLQLSYNQEMDTPEALLRELQMIECANLFDQDSLSKWPGLARMWLAQE